MGKTVTAVVVAAGSSSRMGFDKLACPLGGGTVLGASLAAFDRHPLVTELVLVYGQNEALARAEAARCQKPVTLAPGGPTRAASVANGVRAAAGELVAIHDAARPFVSGAVIAAALEAAAEMGAAAPAVPVKDTVKRAAGGLVQDTPPRETLWAVQTPQCFDRDLLSAALVQPDGVWTDDCAALEQLGVRVRLTPGEERNFKVTTPLDLQLARLLAAEENEHNEE